MHTPLQGLGTLPISLSLRLTGNTLTGWAVPGASAGVAAATSKIRRERLGRDVYVVGAANVGKSAFVRAMLKVRRWHILSGFGGV